MNKLAAVAPLALANVVVLHRVSQRSREWRALRCGKLTASDAADAISTTRSGESALRRKLKAQIVAERFTGLPYENGYVTAAMQRGIDMEPNAIAAYEARSGVFVDRAVGFIERLDYPVGYSPDGLIDADGLVEVKCPDTQNHIGYLLEPGTLAAAYMAQVQHGLWVSDRQWCDLVSFDDRMPPSLQLAIVRIARGAETDTYRTHALLFLSDVDACVAKLKTLEAQGDDHAVREGS